MNKKKSDVSLSKDVWFVLGALLLFFLGLFGVGLLDTSSSYAQAYHLMDILHLLVKVTVVSLMAWGVKRFVFTQTLGKDFGDMFNDGWNKLAAKEKTRWIIVAFLVLFCAISQML